MKFKLGVDYNSFLQSVKLCKHDVYFITSEGDRLNLNSALSQFIFTAVIAGQMPHPEGEVLCQEEDLPLLTPYLSA